MSISLRAFLVYAHLLFLIVGVGSVLLSDTRLVRSLVAYLRSPGSQTALPDMRDTQKKVFWSLLLLSVSGVAIVAIDLQAGGAVSSKLALKVVAVLALTSNGVLLHRLAFPEYVQAASWSELMRRACFTRVLILGAISTYLWLVTAFVGVTHELKLFGFERLLIAFVVGLLATCLLALLMAQMLRRHHPLGNGT